MIVGGNFFSSKLASINSDDVIKRIGQGTIDQNKGEIEELGSEASVTTNYGNVLTNAGKVVTNFGTVKSSSGQLIVNQAEAKVEAVTNGGGVTNNLGLIGILEVGSTLTANFGTVETNLGKIIMNQGTIRNNTLEGSVINNVGTIVN